MSLFLKQPNVNKTSSERSNFARPPDVAFDADTWSLSVSSSLLVYLGTVSNLNWPRVGSLPRVSMTLVLVEQNPGHMLSTDINMPRFLSMPDTCSAENI